MLSGEELMLWINVMKWLTAGMLMMWRPQVVTCSVMAAVSRRGRLVHAGSWLSRSHEARGQLVSRCSHLVCSRRHRKLLKK